MDDKQLTHLLEEIAEEDAPAASIDLWGRIEAQAQHTGKGATMEDRPMRTQNGRSLVPALVSVGLVAALVLVAAVVFLPGGPRTAGEPIQVEEGVIFGDRVELVAFDGPSAYVNDTGTIMVVLDAEWNVTDGDRLTGFVHIVDSEGDVVAVGDLFIPGSGYVQLLADPGMQVAPRTPPGRYEVQVGVFDGKTHERLPLPDGSTIYTLPVTVRIPWALAAAPTPIPMIEAEEGIVFGERITLEAFTAPPPVFDGNRARVLLDWDTQDWQGLTGFVHVLDSDGQLIAQSDVYAPAGGIMPDPDVRGGHPVEIPWETPPGEYTIQVGFYESGERLPLPDGSTAYTLPVTLTVIEREEPVQPTPVPSATAITLTVEMDRFGEPILAPALRRFQALSSVGPTDVEWADAGAFCRGEADLAAGLPLTAEQRALCEQNGITYREEMLAYYAVGVLLNAENDWAGCLSLDDLRLLIGSAAQPAVTWSDVDPAYPDERVLPYLPDPQTETATRIEAAFGLGARMDENTTFSTDPDTLLTGVGAEPGAITLFDDLTAVPEGLRLVGIEGSDGSCVEPRSAVEGRYALSVPVAVVINEERVPQGARFADFLREILPDLLEGTVYMGVWDPLTTPTPLPTLSPNPPQDT